MRGRTCSTCHWWQQRDGADTGECRLNPPTAHLVQGAPSPLAGTPVAIRPLAIFPPTHATTWCGSWCERDESGTA